MKGSILSDGFWTPRCTILKNCTASFSVESLFKNGEIGVYYDMQKYNSTDQITDLSGNENHAIQLDNTKQALLLTDLNGYKSFKFDGLNTSYHTNEIDLSHTDTITIICVAKKLADLPTYSIIAEFSEVYNNNVGTFALFGTGTETVHTVSLSRNLGVANSTSIRISAPSDLLMTGFFKGGVSSKFQVNDLYNESLNTQEDGRFGKHKLYIGQRNGTGLSFNGQIYALLIIDRLLTEDEIKLVENKFSKYIE